MPKTIEEIMADLEKLQTSNAELSAKVAELSARKPTPPEGEDITPEMAEFISGIEGAEELGKQAQEIATRRIADEQRKQHVKEFCAAFVGGTQGRPFGLKVRASELAAALLSLPDKQRTFLEKVLTATADSLIDFAEHGYNAANFAQGKPIPTEYREAAKIWVRDSGKPILDWFKEFPELGDPKDYNLAEFAPKEA